MTDKMINNRIARMKELQAQADAISKQVEALRDELKAELDSRKEDSIDTGIHRVFYNCYERATIDSDKLKAAGLYDKYSKKSVVTQFKITDVKVV